MINQVKDHEYRKYFVHGSYPKRNVIDDLIAENIFERTPMGDELFLRAMQTNFKHHYEHCLYYRKICERRRFDLTRLQTFADVWDIPFILSDVYKHYDISTRAPGLIRHEFTSSGTSGRRSKVAYNVLTGRRIIFLNNYVYKALGLYTPEIPTNYLMMCIDPAQDSTVGTTNADMFVSRLAPIKNMFFGLGVDKGGVMVFHKTRAVAKLREFVVEGAPIRILGFMHHACEVILEYCHRYGKLNFPPHSYILYGGGWKNFASNYGPDFDLFAFLGEKTNIDFKNIRDVYSLNEHAIFYLECEEHRKHIPNVALACARDPRTLERLPMGQNGLLHLYTPVFESYPGISLLTTDYGSVSESCSCGRPGPWLTITGRAGITKKVTCALTADQLINRKRQNKMYKNELQHFQSVQILHGNPVYNDQPLNAEQMASLIAQGRKILHESPMPSHDQLMKFFERLHQAWSDPGYQFRKITAELLEKTYGMDPVFVAQLLDKFPSIFSPDTIDRKFRGELGDPLIMDQPVVQPETGLRLIASPAGLVLHVVAGNVFLNSVESLVDGIITRNVNYFKMSSSDRHFPVLFAASMKECDREGVVCQRLSFLAWQGGEAAVENIFKSSMDRIIFWGGPDGLAVWKKDLGPETILVQHGPKIGFGVVSKAGLEQENIESVTDKIAFDVSIWEQKACSSPQIIFIEETTPRELRERFLTALGESMKKISAQIPPSKRTADDYVEVFRARELALAKDIMTQTPVSVIGPESMEWKIIYEESPAAQKLELSPLNRTILIRHYASAAALMDVLKGQAFYIQTVGYCLGKNEVADYALSFSRRGVTRMCPFGSMTILTAGAPHDGSYSLHELTRFTVLESLPFQDGLSYEILTSRNKDYISPETQNKMRHTKLLIAGCGMGSGVPVCASRLGFENFILADGDTVAVHNLNRQFYDLEDAGKPKVEALKHKILRINPAAKVETFNGYVNAQNVDAIVGKADILFDTVDFLDLPAILALHNTAKKYRIPRFTALNVGFGAMVWYFPADSDLTLGDMIAPDMAKCQTGAAMPAYADVFELFVRRLAPHLDREVVDHVLQVVEKMKDKIPCPASQVAVGSFGVCSLVMSMIRDMLNGDPVPAAPKLVIHSFKSYQTKIVEL